MTTAPSPFSIHRFQPAVCRIQQTGCTPAQRSNFQNGAAQRCEVDRPANALIALLLTAAAPARLAPRPARVFGVFHDILYCAPITGHPPIVMALMRTLVDVARHELPRHERGRFAEIASGLNHARPTMFAVVSVGYAVVALI